MFVPTFVFPLIFKPPRDYIYRGSKNNNNNKNISSSSSSSSRSAIVTQQLLLRRVCILQLAQTVQSWPRLRGVDALGVHNTLHRYTERLSAVGISLQNEWTK